MTIGDVNALDQASFVKQVGWVFEHSPWVAERAWPKRPFASREMFHQALCNVMLEGSQQEQLDLLCAHPDLGTKAKMSDASVGEQTNAGLDRLTPEEFESLHQLNSAYKQRFGFPFLFAVKGSTKHDILAALHRRLSSSLETEFQEALNQVSRIARFRLEGLITDGTV